MGGLKAVGGPYERLSEIGGLLVQIVHWILQMSVAESRDLVLETFLTLCHFRYMKKHIFCSTSYILNPAAPGGDWKKVGKNYGLV